MNSLRARLTLGFSLIAIIPLIVAMTLLGQRIQSTVRAQADDRLNATLGVLRGQFEADGTRLGEKLALLARDPELKRLYLVETATRTDLPRYLADQQFLLDLDFLLVADTSGRVVADASTAPSTPARGLSPPPPGAPPATPLRAGVGLTPLPDVRALALDGIAPIRYRDETVGILRAGIVIDAARLGRLAKASGVELALVGADGHVAAGTLAELAGPAGSALGTAPRRLVLGGRSMLARGVPLAIGPEPHSQLVGLVSTAAADETVAALRWTSVLLGLLGLGIAVALGIVWSLQVSRPVERLASFSERIARGEWDEPLALDSVRELQTLVAALERMRGDLRAYRERLVAGERQAAYGEMARQVAHEIKNPLTPIAIAVADLKRSHEQQRADFPQVLEQAVRTIGEEVNALKRLLQEFSDFGRFPSPQFAPFDIADLVADLDALYGREVAERRLVLERVVNPMVVRADRAQLRQVLINLIQNGLDATAAGGRVALRAGMSGETLEISVSDDGPGLDEERKAQLFVPGFTTKTHGSGLGLAIARRIVTDHRGTITAESSAGHGVAFTIRLPAGQEG